MIDYFHFFLTLGPIDSRWIENLNTLLDENRLLTLLNGDRITLTSQVSLLFEVEDLNNASPATVSRAGILYFNTTNVWQQYFQLWAFSKRSGFIYLLSYFDFRC